MLQKNILNTVRSLAVLLLAGFLLNSCKKFVDVAAPDTSTNGANVYTTDATAGAVLTGVYTGMSGSSLASGTSVNSFLPLYSGLSADELTIYTNSSSVAKLIPYYTNALVNSSAINIWSFTYPKIFTVNSAIAGINATNTLTPAVKQQLLGEAKFLRAYFYFYLTNLYGDVPLATGTDYTVNGLLARTPQAQVYQQIIADLKDAQNLLSQNYLGADLLTPTSDRIRPTKWAATALLARAYLYSGDYANAEIQATTVISNTTQFSLSSLNNAFLKTGNPEAIWQLQPINLGWNSEDARLFILPAAGPGTNNPVYLSSVLLAAFEPGDQRRVKWVNSITIASKTYYYSYKYKSATINSPVTEYETLFRLAEQYLIRAEARAQQNNIGGAQADLNAIRTRAGLGNTTAADKPGLLTAILHEREVELFTEGHRWLDLKRTGTADAVMSVVTPQKGGSWSPNWKNYPLPLIDLLADPNLVQNLGY